MALKARLSIQLFADNVVVAESDDEHLWRNVLSAMQGSPQNIAGLPARNGSRQADAAGSLSLDSGEGEVDSPDLAAFFSKNEKLKPSDNAYLCAAFHFSQFGNSSFSLDDIRTIASEAGLVIPDRLDMTLKGAGKGGKKLFTPTGRDAYKPTAAAGLLFKERWDVKPGRKNKDAGNK